MKHLKNALAAFLLALVAAIYWFFSKNSANIKTTLYEDILAILKISVVFFSVFFVIYFGYSFVIRASRHYHTSEEDEEEL